MTPDIIVVGAGVAGLSCARTLAASGRRVVILDKARGMGGRCATRRVEEQPVDFGVVFLHGSDPGFLAALRSVKGATALPGWPERVHGSGPPCQPDAFAPGEQRLAFEEGMTAFPKHLARGLDVRPNTRIVSLTPAGGHLALRADTGPELSAPTVILALPVEQTRGLLESLASLSASLDGARHLLGMIASLPCLALIAGYTSDAEAPEWDIDYPEDSRILQLICHDSAKRPEPQSLVMVYQARPRWSREHLEAAPETWGQAILEEAERLLGPWAARPIWLQTHRWRFARTDQGSELAGPMLLSLPGGPRLGLAGEIFSPGGGIEAAWKSGRRLAERLLEEESR